MKILLSIILTTICVMNAPIQANDTLSQFSTIDALIQGIYSAKASWEHLEKFSVELPNDPAFAKADLSHHDAAMLKKVEQK